jgi:hypothetical protein
MKKLFFLFVVTGLSAALHANAQACPPPFAQITFTDTFHDFGTIQRGSDCRWEFQFRNTGTAPLIIISAMSACGCDVAEGPKEPIPVGGTGVIRYHYDSNRMGAFQKSVSVTSNSKNKSVQFLKIIGNIPYGSAPVPKTTDMDAAPKPMIMFENEVIDRGNIELNSDGKVEIYFTNTGDAPVIITSVKTGSDNLKIEKPGPVAPGQKGVIIVEVPTDKPVCLQKEVTVISNAVNKKSAVITLKCIVLGPLMYEK